jgi:hypothetical protein
VLHFLSVHMVWLHATVALTPCPLPCLLPQIAHKDLSYSFNPGWSLALQSDGTVWASFASGSSKLNLNSYTSVADGSATWHHVALVMDRANRRALLYVPAHLFSG